MDTPIFCVYNLARRVFLSSKVSMADTVNQPLKVLKDLVGLDSESGLWLTPLLGRPTIPKLFPYDLVYLDKDHRVVEMIEVLPGIEFPAHRREVTSAIVLPPDTLRKSQTHIGDHLAVCRQNEFDERLVAGASETIPGSVDKFDGLPCLEQAMPVGSTGKPEPIHGAFSGVAAESTLLAESLSSSPPPAAAMSDMDVAKPADTADAGIETHRVSITEVIIEPPHHSPPPVDLDEKRRTGLEDLFGNWVDSPSASPSWIAQRARELESKTLEAAVSTGDSQEAEAEPMKGSEPQTPAAPEPAAVRPDSAAPPADQAREPNQSAAVLPPLKLPVVPKIPQTLQNTTFTIGQYGIWQLSTPTVLSPKRGVSSGAGQVASRGAPGKKSPEGQKSESRTSTKRTADVRAPLPLKPKQIPTPVPAAEKAATEKAPTAKIASPASETSRAAKATVADLPTLPRDTKKIEANATAPIPPVQAPPQKLELKAVRPAREPVQKDSGPPNPAPGSEPARAASEGQLRSERTVGAAKPTPADIATSLQDRLEKLQVATAGTTAGTAAPAPRPIPAPETKPLFANDSQAAKTRPTPPTVPDRPAAKFEARKETPVRHEPPPSPPPPRFLKPKQDLQKEKPKISTQQEEGAREDGAHSDSFGARFRRWLKPAPSTKTDRRRAHRRYVPGMVAHYYTGGGPKPYEIADISLTGLYVLTEDRWVPDTMIRMTLQKPCAKGDKKQSITVLSRVVRRGSDGVAAEFVMQDSIDPNSRDILPAQGTDKSSLVRFL